MSTCSKELPMSHCVPSWELEDNTTISIPTLANCNINETKASDVTDPRADYEVAELTWENGQLALHGLGPPRPPATAGKLLSSRYTPWEKPLASGTLESVVNQAAQLAPCEIEPSVHRHDSTEYIQWYNHMRGGRLTMDALVPSADPNHGNSTCVESCKGSPSINNKGKEVDTGKMVKKRHRVPPLSRNNQSMSVGVDSCEMGFTSTSFGSDTNPNTLDDHDSMSHSRPPKHARTEEEKSCQNEKSTISTKRSRAAAIHNQSERKRRDKINQRMKTLQKLVPNSSKTDKASMLDEVIDYLKTLQAQVQMMGRMSMPPIMMPMPMQQQLQMAMMAQMGMGMSMGMGVMDINTMGRPHIPGMPPVINPAAFMPMTSWEGPNERLASSNPGLADPMASFLACQAQQPMSMDAYSRMASMYQQLHQQHGSIPRP